MNWKSPGSSIIFSTTSGWLEMATKAPSAASCFGLMVVSPCGAAHIAMLEVAVEPAVFVAEARDVADQGRAAHAFGVGLRTAQDEALVEFPKQIGAPVQQHVIDGVGAGDQAFAARHLHLQAEHGDDADLPAPDVVRGLEAA